MMMARCRPQLPVPVVLAAALGTVPASPAATGSRAGPHLRAAVAGPARGAARLPVTRRDYAPRPCRTGIM
jgi:hypothetical protein